MKSALPVAVALAALSACTVPVRYAPERASEPLHAAKLPPLVLDEVVDEAGRGNIHCHHSGNIDESPLNAAGQPVDAEIPWSSTVREALALELTRLGWPVAAAGTPGAARLKATVVAARADYRPGFGVQADGKLLIEIILAEADGREVWQEQLEGAGVGTIGAAGSPENGLRQAWNAALNDAIPRLGPILSKERPWELLGKDRPVVTASAPSPDAWWKK